MCKAQRQESLNLHLSSILSKLGTADVWGMLLRPLCMEIELEAERQFPNEIEEKVSMRCHRRLRKLGNALRSGWELELLGLVDVQQGHLNQTFNANAKVICSALLERLETLGPAKNTHWRHIKEGDREGAAALGRASRTQNSTLQQLGASVTTEEEYRKAIVAQRTTMWHRHAIQIVNEVLEDRQVELVLDIGSSFNPLKGNYKHVDAIDIVPSCASVLTADFLKVAIRPGISSLQRDGSNTSICVAVPCAYYNAALISFVIRSLPSIQDRCDLVQRAAKTLKPGGILLIVERGPLYRLLKFKSLEKSVWGSMNLTRVTSIKGLRGIIVNVFERTW